MASRNILAFDIGAESGRAILGRFDGRRIAIKELHRFSNGPVRMRDTLYWAFPKLWQEVLTGLTKATSLIGAPASVGVDTWGVDYGFLDENGDLLRNPICYRDARTEGMLEAAFAVVPREDLYSRTGIQFMRLNTLFQLLSEKKKHPNAPFSGVSKMLFTPDLVNYFLTGTIGAEFTIASTSQMLDARAGTWDLELLTKLGIPMAILPEIIPTGSSLGKLLPGIVEETEAAETVCIATTGHDTAAAVAAAPADGDDWAFISSGTWSLMGAELPAPMLSDAALANNFTNEGGVAGTIRFLKNIMGLWLVQQCRKSFEKHGGVADYTNLTQQAADAPAFGSIINPDDDRFLNPLDMPTAIQDFCRQTGQRVPEFPGSLVRTCLESLALRYRWTLEAMEQILGKRFGAIHVVGGGSKNMLLCQMTADCCRRPVIAGPAEATALGNCLVQAIGLGELRSLADVRAVVRASTDTTFFPPIHDDRWDEQYARFQGLIGGANK
jgi:rhamnulokinase